jgi:transposase/uncharacterized coiled-coil protein SlyX
VSLEDKSIEELRETCVAQAYEIAQLQSELKVLKEKHLQSLNRLFGKSSEHSSAAQEVMVFDEAEAFTFPLEPEPPVEEVIAPAPAAKKKGQRNERIANLETQENEYPASEEQKICPCCGEEMHFVDWQVRKEIKYIPAKMVLNIDKQPIYACRSCQKEGEAAPIHTIKTMPEPAFPKSLASPSLVSHIISQKFVMGSPLYRQEQNMSGLGALFSRQTMANWMISAANLLHPVYGRMKQILLTMDVIHADETKVQVLKEPGRSATTDSTMWLYRSGRDGPPIVLFDYQTTRAGKHAKEFLDGFGQYDNEANIILRIKYLHVDGYDGYHIVPRVALIGGKKEYDIILVGCWAHARRKFFEAAAIVTKADRKSGKRIAADEGLKLCDELFEIEAEFKNMTAEERYNARQNRSVAKLTQIKTWLDKAIIEVLPKTATGQAIAYCINQWSKLTAFLQDGRLEIDNNRAERSIKPFVIGRKNWLFANTPRGATSSAILYSIIETAKENGLVPFEYVKFLLEQLPNIDTKKSGVLDTVLPWSETIPTHCRKP